MSRWTIHSTYTQRTITQLREAILPHMTTWTALKDICCCCSVAKWCPTLWPHGLEHTRLPCPSLSPGVCSDSYPLSQWCYLTISSSAALFSSCPQSFPASGILQWVNSSRQVAKVLEFQLQHQSFPWIFRVDFLSGWLVWSPFCTFFAHYHQRSFSITSTLF